MSDTTDARARALVLEHGWNATAYQILNPGIAHWFSRAGDAVIGYVTRSGVRVVAGAPVCAEERLHDVVAEFAADARAAGDRVCYFGAG
ncbi:MAG TPA: phosphatidylglycerol lysyltransferase domain-containing protein, partial [Gemmatimonadaceae bacterium]|nr:phosphatidylglycerol lysyltransferase domain-containing protein [Gemmatimonadaceae bacterium]